MSAQAFFSGSVQPPPSSLPGSNMWPKELKTIWLTAFNSSVLERQLSAGGSSSTNSKGGEMEQRARRGAFLPAPLPGPLSHVAITARHVSSASSANFSPGNRPLTSRSRGGGDGKHDRVKARTKPRVWLFVARGPGDRAEFVLELNLATWLTGDSTS